MYAFSHSKCPGGTIQLAKTSVKHMVMKPKASPNLNTIVIWRLASPLESCDLGSQQTQQTLNEYLFGS